MKQIVLKAGATPAAPRVTEDSFYPNIDSNYTAVSHTGQRLVVNTSPVCGIRTLSSTRATNKQGMAIYGDLMVTLAANNGTHYIYTIGTGGALTQVTTFSVSLGHANAAQFAPTIASGKTYPYLYVSDTDGHCYVLEIASNYAVTKVQTITIAQGQCLIGDDGYIWASINGGSANPRIFKKYRKVAVSEGDITLTSDDILDSFSSDKSYSSSDVTAQGWAVKYGKIWFCFGASGSGQKRGVDVYDTATHRRVAELDFSSYSTLEYEDIDFWDNAMLIATYPGTMYMVRF